MSVHQRNTKKGTWYVNITHNGLRIRRAIKEARTKKEAKIAESKILGELFENRWGNGGQKNFAEFVEQSYKPFAEENHKGFYVECSALKALVKRFGNLKLCDISPEDIEKFKRDRCAEKTRLGKQRSKATVNRDVAVLSMVFNLAQSYGELKENPVNKTKYYTNLPSRDRVLSELEEKILFNHIRKDEKFSNQVEILLYTGMRRGELFKLEWRDIDLTNFFINIRKETTKTQKARVLPMLTNVKAIFERLSIEAGEINLTDKVFEGIKSQDIALSTVFTNTCKELGFVNLTIHSLRHTYSTRVAESKIGAFVQKALLGHSKLTMTDRYTHLSKESLKENIEPMEQYINRRKGAS